MRLLIPAETMAYILILHLLELLTLHSRGQFLEFLHPQYPLLFVDTIYIEDIQMSLLNIVFILSSEVERFTFHE